MRGTGAPRRDHLPPSGSQAEPKHPIKPATVPTRLERLAQAHGAATELTNVLNGDLAETLDQLSTYYQSEKLKDATGVS